MAALVDTATILQERRDIDFSNRILELEPEAGPLTVLLKKLEKSTADTSIFHWFESERNPRWTAYAGAGEASPQTSVPVTSGTGSYFRTGDLIKVPRTGEVMLVNSVAGDTLTVTRGYGTTTAANLQSGDALLLMANAYPENAKAGSPRLGQPVLKTNYTQIIRTPVSISGTLDAEKQRAQPQERVRLQRRSGVEHLVSIEYNLWFGEPKLDTTPADGPRRTTGGVLYWVTENVLDVASENSGNLTYSLFEQWLEMAFRYGSSTKWLFASPRLISVIDTLAAGKLQMRPRDETYGIAVRTWVSAHGEVNIIKHNLFEGNEYGKMGVLLDLNTEDLAYVYLPGRDTKLRLNVGDPDRDGFLDEWLTECGLRFPQAKRHGMITGVNAAA